MNIDYEKIKEIYGEKVLESLKNEEELNNFIKNIKYLSSKNIECIDEIINSYYLIFLYDYSDFKEKIDNLITKLGDNYNDIIGNNMGVLEELL